MGGFGPMNVENKQVYVAVYGTLRKNSGNHRLLVGNKYIGTYYLDRVNATMYTNGSFPALLYDEKGGKLVCEVYKIDGETFNRLDRLEGYPSHYDRIYMSEMISDGSIIMDGNKDITNETWIYVYRGEASYSQLAKLPSGDFIKDNDKLR